MRLLIVLLPWLELFTLVQLGVETSALTVVGYVLLTLVLGLLLLQRQGVAMFERLGEMQRGRVLGPELLLGDMAIGLAGLLLMFPGVITDGFAALILVASLGRRLLGVSRGGAPAPGEVPRSPRVEPYNPRFDREAELTIEGQYTRVDEQSPSQLPDIK